MVLQDGKGAWGKYYETRKKLWKEPDTERRKQILNCFTFIFLVLVQPRNPQTKTLQKAHGSLRCIASLKTLEYTSQNRKRMSAGIFFNLGIFCPGTYGRTRVGVLPKSFSSADSKVLHSVIHSYPPRLHWNKKLPGPVCWIWPLEYISGMSYETLHLALNLLGISCIYAFCLQICSFVAVAFRMPHVRYDYYNPSLIVCTEEFLKYVPFTYKTHVKITDGWRKMLLCCSFLCFHRQVSE